jgi:hypothetical protein
MDTQQAQHSNGRAEHARSTNELPKKTVGGLDRVENETTPLLDGGTARPRDGQNANEEHEWEGTADFKGLSWWKTPSVCRVRQSSCASTATSISPLC